MEMQGQRQGFLNVSAAPEKEEVGGKMREGLINRQKSKIPYKVRLGSQVCRWRHGIDPEDISPSEL